MDQQPCIFLRTKKLYTHDASAWNQLLEDEAGIGEGPHCWCNKTMVDLGPDDIPVTVKSCSSGKRKCYQAN